VNPYRYAGYYWDRKTQMYFLQARYYDPREARFISADSYRGEGEHPLSLNLYTYALNNPVNLVDPTGHMSWWQIDDLAMGILSSLGDISGLFKYKTLDALWQTVKAIAKGKISFKDIARSFVSSVTGPFMYLYNNTKWVWTGDPSNKEVKYYGNQLGTALQLVVGSAGAMKAIVKFVPKLTKLLDKIKTKKSSSSSNSNNRSGGCNCFVAGTKVLTDEGEKNIEDIEVGDKGR
jgi:RHS repeat-associated protein